MHYTLKLGVTGLLPPGAVIAVSKLGTGPAAANGGVKLGVGPLARAYAEAGQVAIDACERIIVRDMSRATVFCLYDDVSTVTRTLEEYEAKFTATYADAITFDVEVASEHIDVLIEAITSRTNARAGSLKISAE